MKKFCKFKYYNAVRIVSGMYARFLWTFLRETGVKIRGKSDVRIAISDRLRRI